MPHSRTVVDASLVVPPVATVGLVAAGALAASASTIPSVAASGTRLGVTDVTCVSPGAVSAQIVRTPVREPAVQCPWGATHPQSYHNGTLPSRACNAPFATRGAAGRWR